MSLRREARTRGHAFVVELAYRMIQTLSKQWRQLDLTVEQGIDLLSTLRPEGLHPRRLVPNHPPALR